MFMRKRIQKIAALVLVALLSVVHLTAELAHQHFAPNARPPDERLVWQIENHGPELKSGQLLCPACLFANQHQSLQPAIFYVVNPPPQFFFTPLSSSLFSQFQKIPCRNRAPPV